MAGFAGFRRFRKDLVLHSAQPRTVPERKAEIAIGFPPRMKTVSEGIVIAGVPDRREGIPEHVAERYLLGQVFFLTEDPFKR